MNLQGSSHRPRAVGGAYDHRKDFIYELSKIADKRMYEDKASFYKEAGIDRRTNQNA